MEINLSSINQTFSQDEQTSQIVATLNGSSSDYSGDYLSSNISVTSKDLPDGTSLVYVLDGEIESLARKKLAAYAAGAMPIRVSSINRVYDQRTKQITHVVVFLLGNSTDGSGDYINYRKTITSADLPEGKTFADMSAGTLKSLAKAQLVNDTKVAA